MAELIEQYAPLIGTEIFLIIAVYVTIANYTRRFVYSKLSLLYMQLIAEDVFKMEHAMASGVFKDVEVLETIKDIKDLI